tara:strand:- start:227 stop:418 length:192 start_codon:yes stop_codon:yes gene_type:complete
MGLDGIIYPGTLVKGRTMKQIIKSFKIYTDDADEEKVLVGNDIDTALEILENNGYIIEVEYEK